jgi:hypothetical protein
MAAVNGPVELDLEPKLKKGEVLLDLLARGKFSALRSLQEKNIFFICKPR